MLLPDDDEIYDVDQTYLGPPGRYIGRFRYRMLALAPVVLLIGLAFLWRTGIGFSLLSVALTVMVGLRLTQWVVDKTSQERPIPVLVSMFWHELGARRAPTKGYRTRAPRVFKHRATRIGDGHELPAGHRLRWRSYANRAAAVREGS